jgi:hypothetical protein
MNEVELARLVVHCRKSLYEVYIGRGRDPLTGKPSPFGNPFSHKDGTLAKFKVDTREEALLRYEEWLLSQPDLVVRVKRDLRSRVLGCWCRPLTCHGDILVRIANE